MYFPSGTGDYVLLPPQLMFKTLCALNFQQWNLQSKMNISCVIYVDKQKRKNGGQGDSRVVNTLHEIKIIRFYRLLYWLKQTK